VTDLADRTEALAGIPVEVVAWPRESRRRDALARCGVPRLLVVDAHHTPPDNLGIDEDWIWASATDDDIRARAQQLLRFERRLAADRPYVDDRRILHRAGIAVPLTAREEALLGSMLANIGALVTYDDLTDVGWPGLWPTRGAVEAALGRLRRRLSGLGMSIRTVRCRGVVLVLSGPYLG
jgi:hypothetical protein